MTLITLLRNTLAEYTLFKDELLEIGAEEGGEEFVVVSADEAEMQLLCSNKVRALLLAMDWKPPNGSGAGFLRIGPSYCYETTRRLSEKLKRIAERIESGEAEVPDEEDEGEVDEEELYEPIQRDVAPAESPVERIRRARTR